MSRLPQHVWKLRERQVQMLCTPARCLRCAYPRQCTSTPDNHVNCAEHDWDTGFSRHSITSTTPSPSIYVCVDMYVLESRQAQCLPCLLLPQAVNNPKKSQSNISLTSSQPRLVSQKTRMRLPSISFSSRARSLGYFSWLPTTWTVCVMEWLALRLEFPIVTCSHKQQRQVRFETMSICNAQELSRSCESFQVGEARFVAFPHC